MKRHKTALFAPFCIFRKNLSAPCMSLYTGCFQNLVRKCKIITNIAVFLCLIFIDFSVTSTKNFYFLSFLIKHLIQVKISPFINAWAKNRPFAIKFRAKFGKNSQKVRQKTGQKKTTAIKYNKTRGILWKKITRKKQ